jgi:hypothetical protein
MAFGLLSSALPTAKNNTVLYGSTATDLVEANVSISHKNHNPVRVCVGLSTNNIDVDYLLYNFPLERGETFETDTIYFSRGESVIVKSSDEGTNFVLYGSSLEDSTEYSGLLGSEIVTSRVHKVLYTSPTDTDSTITVTANNLGSHPSEIRIGITSSGTYDLGSANYIEYGREIHPGQNYTRTNVKLTSNQSLIVSASDSSKISYVTHGKVYSNAGGDGGGSGSDFRVFGNLRVDQKVGIGTNPQYDLDVVGNSQITGDVLVGGAVTAFRFSGKGELLTNIPANQLFGPLPALDGSALTGIIATGSGVEIRDNGIAVGTASTISFDSGLEVSFGSGISSVRLSDTINAQRVQVALNKFVADGVTGNVSIANSLTVGAGASFGGTINALNNKVINVGLATAPGDVTNKKYVDSRSILFTIALS